MRAILEDLRSPDPERQAPDVPEPINGREFTYGYHDSREIRGSMVRLILVSEVGLSVEDARKAAR